LVAGTRVLARVHTILPLHLILSLPNNILAHVPITEISRTLTDLLRAEEEESDGSDDGSDDSSSAPDLLALFQPGQYVLAKVMTLYPTASQSFISQYPISETNRLASKVELSLIPEKVNSEVAKADVGAGFQLTGEIMSEEDKGWRVGLGLNADNGLGGVEGWIKREDVEKHSPGR
jgi:rRNA biogenesis protein RRP5